MYKEFDLEKALAGEPLISRDGQPVTEFHFFKTARPDCSYPIAAVVDGSIKSYNRKGEWDNGSTKYSLDLFMAPVKKQAWTNVYPLPGGGVHTSGGCYESEEVAKKHAMDKCIKQVLIHEWEE